MQTVPNWSSQANPIVFIKKNDNSPNIFNAWGAHSNPWKNHGLSRVNHGSVTGKSRVGHYQVFPQNPGFFWKYHGLSRGNHGFVTGKSWVRHGLLNRPDIFREKMKKTKTWHIISSIYSSNCGSNCYNWLRDYPRRFGITVRHSGGIFNLRFPRKYSNNPSNPTYCHKSAGVSQERLNISKALGTVSGNWGHPDAVSFISSTMSIKARANGQG